MKRLLFIYNPVAGSGRVRQALADITERFAAFGYEVVLHPTTARGDATVCARDRAGEFDRIVCAGGDGTLNEVITGLMELPDAPPLGYVPTGTTNDFSRTLGLPTGLTQAAECAMMGACRKVDMGLFNGRPYVYVAAFGLFSDVSYTTPQGMKNTLGHLAYVLSGITRLADIQAFPMRVIHDDEIIEDEFIYGMVSDTVSVGGVLNMNQDKVCLTDGKFEVMLVRKPRSPADLNSIVQSLMRQEPFSAVIGFQARHVEFHSSRAVPWTLDGEFGGNHTDAVIEVRHQAVTMVANPEAEAFRPSTADCPPL